MARYTIDPSVIETDDGMFVSVDNTNQKYLELLASEEPILPYIVVEPVTAPMLMEFWAGAGLTIEEGVVSGVPVGSRIAGVAQMNGDTYMAFFSESLPESYIALVYDDSGRLAGIEKSTDYMMINAPQGATVLNVEIKRVL